MEGLLYFGVLCTALWDGCVDGVVQSVYPELIISYNI